MSKQTFAERIQSNFDKALESVIKRGKTVTEDTQALINFAWNKAHADGDFDYTRKILQGMWTSKRYKTAQNIAEYMKAQGPFKITFDKDKSVFSVKKDKAEGAKAFPADLTVTYYNWSKEAVKVALTLEGGLKALEALVSRVENSDMEGVDKNAIFARMGAISQAHVETNVPAAH